MKRFLPVLAILAFWAVASGCGYLGSARPIDAAEFEKDSGWLAVRDLQFERQKSDNDCGAASVAMVLKHWGQPATTDDVVAGCPTSKDGMRAGDLRDLIKKRGLKGYLIHGTIDDLKTELAAKRPVIVGLIKPYVQGGLNHYEVVMAIHPEQKRLATLDPAKGPRQNTFEGFLQEWKPSGFLTIVVTDRDGKSSFQLPASGFPPETVNSSKPLTPLMAAPHPGGAIPFPSGCRRPSFARNAGEFGVLYRYEGWTGNQEACFAGFDE